MADGMRLTAAHCPLSDRGRDRRASEPPPTRAAHTSPVPTQKKLSGFSRPQCAWIAKMRCSRRSFGR